MTSQPDLSVVIAAHDAEHVIGRQLRALARQADAPPFEVIVVLNRCTDHTGDVAQAFADRLDLRVVHADDAAGVGHARNIGWRAARSSMVLFCDADEEVADRWVSRMAAGFAASDGVVAGRVCVDRTALRRWMYQARYAPLDGVCVHTVDYVDTPFGLGANLGVRTDLLRVVGGFDERFAGVGFEEIDLQLRLARLGHEVVAVDDALVMYTPRTTVASMARQARAYLRGLLVHQYLESGRRPSGHRPRPSTGVPAWRRAARLVRHRRPWHPMALAWIAAERVAVALDVRAMRRTPPPVWMRAALVDVTTPAVDGVP